MRYQEPTLFLFKKLWRFAGNNRKNIILFIALSVIGNSLLLAGPLLFGAVIREIETQGASALNLKLIILLLSLIFLKEFAFWLFHGPSRVIERMTAFKSVLNYRQYLLQGVINLKLKWHNGHDSGDTIDKINKAGEGLLEFSQSIYQIIQTVVRLCGTSFALLWFSPWIGIGVLIYAILLFIITVQFDKRLIPQYTGLNKFDNKASASVFDTLSNITTVKILHIEQSVLSGVMARFKASRALYWDNIKLNEWKWFVVSMGFTLISVLPVAGYISYKFKQGNIDVGSVSTLFLYLADLAFVFFGFGAFYEQLTQYKYRVLNAEPIEQAFLDNSGFEPHRNTPHDWHELKISDLWFDYNNDGKNYHLNGVSIKITRGDRIAIIGESGSGKTTLLKVLHGMYDSTRGLISFDNEPSMQTCFADQNLKTMLVPQEPEIFSSSVLENITLGIEYTEQKIMRAAKLAAFNTVIDQLPKGLHSIINEKGVNLSGGQKQRLALTRALLFADNKDLILLDESTSSVDPKNEELIYQNIFNTFSKKTIVASVHKLSLLKFFNWIVIFEKGNIVDQGTFADLLKRNDAFRIAWKSMIARDNKG